MNASAGRGLGEIDSRSRAAFGLLILAQAAHSVEEYAFRLFDVFAPARFVSGLISSNAALGFAVANIALVAFGAWCFVARVRPSQSRSRCSSRLRPTWLSGSRTMAGYHDVL